MDSIDQYSFLLKNIVVWAILLNSFFVYGVLLDLIFFRVKDAVWYESSSVWQPTIKMMLTALPLLGLLGTIAGLMSTFTSIAVEKGLPTEELITGGIAEAMLTTQLGLVLVVPGLLLLTYLGSQHKEWEVEDRK